MGFLEVELGSESLSGGIGVGLAVESEGRAWRTRGLKNKYKRNNTTNTELHSAENVGSVRISGKIWTRARPPFLG